MKQREQKIKEQKEDWTQQRRTMKNVLHKANYERSNIDSKIKGSVEKQKIPQNPN